VLRFIMESGAKGCEVIVSGKLRAQRAKAMKFKVCLFTPHSRFQLFEQTFATCAHMRRYAATPFTRIRYAVGLQDGYMISSGHPVNDYIDGAVRHVMLRQGVLGIKVGLLNAGFTTLIWCASQHSDVDTCKYIMVHSSWQHRRVQLHAVGQPVNSDDCLERRARAMFVRPVAGEDHEDA
jgi:hypothetical protein